ncbi:putative zinc-binding peptidase [Acidovorax sp. SUPP1855]|uniref:zinc-binding metallopeptidase family protein n=1 Tax=Acidovorax sp. SUPP1855 TaxID=431774 RepID=UPI0024E0866A|nr:putative zinc-binding peptidase [Acidovorax sp. SUPP1855]
MQVFNCDQCGHLVFFDSVQCLHCGAKLAFLPDQLTMAALVPAVSGLRDDSDLWERVADAGRGSAQPLYRLCHHRTAHRACNFALQGDDPQALCVSCRQTRILPDLSEPANLRRWKQIEHAKRQLYYTLAKLGLEPAPPGESPAFEFLADQPGYPVITGHSSGTITLNIAEADDDERARRRLALHEPYRTLIGHLRHESGHFYWDRLLRDQGKLDHFRAVFGDERQDYGAALQAYYASSPHLRDWGDHHVSAYATAHPWEDWAETWAHYLHMVDLLETASSYRTGLQIPKPKAGAARRFTMNDPFATQSPDFDAMVSEWVPLTLLLNSLNRSLGQQDAYPFALSSGALAKLRFVHELVQSARNRARPEPLKALQA